MRQLLRLIGTRYGAAVSIVVVIAIVVAFGKLVGGSRAPSSFGSDQGSPAATVSAPADASGSAASDDGVGPEMDASASPSTSPGAAGADTIAVNFTKAWLNHHNISAADWHKGIAKYSTKTLSDRLEGVDPGAGPAAPG